LQSHSLGTYLGCLVIQGRQTRSTFQGIISKTTTRLDRCKANAVSKAGRTILIQPHLEFLPAHTMQCFHLRLSTSSQLDTIHRNFFWKTSYSNNGLPIIAWDKICKPKAKGGLGSVNR